MPENDVTDVLVANNTTRRTVIVVVCMTGGTLRFELPVPDARRFAEQVQLNATAAAEGGMPDAAA